MTEVTLLLSAAKAGHAGAEQELWETVYQELRRMAGELMSRESREVTLSGTALLHEAWLRLTGGNGSAREWDNRGHFFAAAAEAMRRILVDQARARLRQKRGGGHEHVSIDEVTRLAAPEDEKLLQVHEVLDELARVDAQKANIVKLRYFVGFNNHEIAALLGVSAITVRRQWKLARIWLYQALKDSAGSGAVFEESLAGKAED